MRSVLVVLFACFLISHADFASRPTDSPSPVTSTPILNTNQVTLLRQYVNQRFGLSTRTPIPQCNSPGTSAGLCLPKLVRMGFHSCVGGCTGCINLDLPDNAGLSGIKELLNIVYLSDFQFDGKNWVSVSQTMTRADFWAFAANEAILQGSRFQSGPLPTLTFTWGRQSCTDPNGTRTDAPIFPAGDAGCNQAFAVFSNMGLTRTQMVALIGGGHSLGAAHLENSGYDGHWAPDLDVFSNSFFQFLQNPMSIGGYKHVLAPSFKGSDGITHQKWQFKGITQAASTAFLLDSDVCMFWNIGDVSLDATTSPLQHGKLSCSGSSSCQPHLFSQTTDNDARNAVNAFAGSSAVFNSVFAKAWQIMLATGFSSLSGGLYVGDSLYNPCFIQGIDTCCGSSCQTPTPVPVPVSPQPAPTSNPTPVPSAPSPKTPWSTTPSPTSSWNSPNPPAPTSSWSPSPKPGPTPSWSPNPTPNPVPAPSWNSPQPSSTCTDSPGNWQFQSKPIDCTKAPGFGWCNLINPSCALSCGRCGTTSSPAPTTCTDNPLNWQFQSQPIDCTKAPGFGWCSIITPACAKSCRRC